LEELLALADSDHQRRGNIGEAAMYGVLYDDTEYDYMQHLRQVGVQEDGVESILVEAPPNSRKQTGKGKGQKSIALLDLPSEALPSRVELPRNYESEEAIPSSIAGFQPDMDPHLRQALEALEDDAFVDDEVQDDFFQQLVADGERRSDEDVTFEFFDDRGGEEAEEHKMVEAGDEGWEARFERFKREQKVVAPTSGAGSDLDCRSEGGDTISRLPEFSVIGGKRRRRGTSDASGYSMSSSSLYRTEALQTLDESFDQVSLSTAVFVSDLDVPFHKMILREYTRDDGHEDGDDGDALSDDFDTAPQLIASREDFTSMVDDFLDHYEIVGSRMKPKLAGDNGIEKLETLRNAMGQDERIMVAGQDSDEGDMLMPLEEVERKERWDCETILSEFAHKKMLSCSYFDTATYSNLENHPRLIRARDTEAVQKIRLDPRTGLPRLSEQTQHARIAKGVTHLTSEETDEDMRKCCSIPGFCSSKYKNIQLHRQL
jgi:protein LTV1